MGGLLFIGKSKWNVFSFLRSKSAVSEITPSSSNIKSEKKPLAAGTHWEVRGPLYHKERDLGYLQTDWTKRQLRRCFPQLGEDWFNEGKTRRQRHRKSLREERTLLMVFCLYWHFQLFCTCWMVRRDWNGLKKGTKREEEGHREGKNPGWLWCEGKKFVFTAREKKGKAWEGQVEEFHLKNVVVLEQKNPLLPTFKKCLIWIVCWQEIGTHLQWLHSSQENKSLQGSEVC